MDSSKPFQKAENSSIFARMERKPQMYFLPRRASCSRLRAFGIQKKTLNFLVRFLCKNHFFLYFIFNIWYSQIFQSMFFAKLFSENIFIITSKTIKYHYSSTIIFSE